MASSSSPAKHPTSASRRNISGNLAGLYEKIPPFLKEAGSTVIFAYLLLRFYFVGFSKTLQIAAVCVCVGGYLFLKRKVLLAKKDNFVLFFVLCAGFGAVLCVSALVPLLHGTGDLSYFRRLISFGLNLLCWLAFYVHIDNASEKKGVSAEREFTSEFSRIMIAYVLFSVVCVVFPSFRTFWQSVAYFSDYEKTKLLIPAYIGRISWSGFAGYGATFMCTLCVFFNCRELNAAKERIKPIQVVNVIFMLVGNFLYGRTGLVVSLGIVAVYIAIAVFSQGRKKLLWGGIGGAIGTAGLLLILYKCSAKMQELIHWALAPIFNLFNGKGLSSGSTDVLFSMLRKDVPLDSFFLGDGYYTDPLTGSYYQAVDVGFLRMIFFAGIFFAILAYVLMLFSVAPSFSKKIIDWIVFSVIFILFEIKGEIWLTIFVIFLPRIFIIDSYSLSGRIKKASDAVFKKFSFLEKFFLRIEKNC